MSSLDFRKELLRNQIDTERRMLGLQVKQLGQSGGPASAAASLGRLAGARIGFLGPLFALLGRGPRLATWARVAAVAYLAAPLVVSWLSRRRRSREGAAEAAE